MAHSGCRFARSCGSQGADFCQAEIENFGVVASGYEDVGRLDVAMHDPFAVGGVECVGDVDGKRQQGFQVQRTVADQVLERPAFEIFHDDEGTSVLLANVIDGADIGMVQARSGLGFAAKAAKGVRIVGDIIGKELEGDEAVQAQIFGLVDDAHPAATEFFNHFVVRDSLADHAKAPKT